MPADLTTRALPGRGCRDLDDEGLIRRCVDGCRRAWDELIDRYGRLVYSIPKRYGLSAADADDVFQEVFTIVHRRLGSIKDPTRLSAWLITIAHRESCRIGRRAGRYVLLDGDLVDDDAPPHEAAAWERQHRVRQALRRLGGPCEQLLIELFSSERPDYQSIARKLGMKVGSIGPTRARCFRKLEPLLAELGIRPDDAPQPQRSEVIASISPGSGRDVASL